MPPFRSQAQKTRFYRDPKLRKYVPTMEAATPPGTKLPHRVKPKAKPSKLPPAHKRLLPG